MMTPTQIREKINAGQAVTVAVVGDSTTAGFGCNPGPNVWTNGLSYGCVNLPAFGPNWTAGNPYAISTTTYPTQAQQDNVLIPSAVRLLRTYIESLNSASRVYNFGIAGSEASTHVAAGTIALVAAKNPKPELVFINLGINTAKNNGDQNADLQTLISQTIAADMCPVLVIAHNIGVAHSTGGVWVAESTPDQWYPMDNWPTVRAGIKSLALGNSIELLDLGGDDGSLDITGLYDSFHPSDLGYQAIFQKYKSWTLIDPIMPFTGQPSGFSAARLRHMSMSQKTTANGAVAFRGSMSSQARMTLKDFQSLRLET